MKKLIAPFADRVHLSTPVKRVTRANRGVSLEFGNGRPPAQYDEVVMACHSDQALRLIADPSKAESSVLGAIPYQENEAVLHSDTSVLPASRRTWAAWNYHKPAEPTAHVAVTYNMNILQRLDARETWCVTLNDRERIDPARIAGAWTYHHPVFGRASTEAQARIDDISGEGRIWFCGAYWGYGFHEDGLRSGQQCADKLQAVYEAGTHAQLHLSRQACPSAA